MTRLQIVSAVVGGIALIAVGFAAGQGDTAMSLFASAVAVIALVSYLVIEERK